VSDWYRQGCFGWGVQEGNNGPWFFRGETGEKGGIIEGAFKERIAREGGEDSREKGKKTEWRGGLKTRHKKKCPSKPRGGSRRRGGGLHG